MESGHIDGSDGAQDQSSRALNYVRSRLLATATYLSVGLAQMALAIGITLIYYGLRSILGLGSVDLAMEPFIRLAPRRVSAF